jgi:hypothetical protein
LTAAVGASAAGAVVATIAVAILWITTSSGGYGFYTFDVLFLAAFAYPAACATRRLYVELSDRGGG